MNELAKQFVAPNSFPPSLNASKPPMASAGCAKRKQSARPPGQGVLNPRPAYHPASPGRVRTLPFPPRLASRIPPRGPGVPKNPLKNPPQICFFFFGPKKKTPNMLQKKPPGGLRQILGGHFFPEWQKKQEFPGGIFAFCGFFFGKCENVPKP